MNKTIIKTNKLCKTFSNHGSMQHVLKNIDLEIYEGDFTVIMGASGAGKSTLLYALSGMDTPTLGNIYFKGEDITKLNQDKLALFRRKNCGFVFQQIYLVDSMMDTQCIWKMKYISITMVNISLMKYFLQALKSVSMINSTHLEHH